MNLNDPKLGLYKEVKVLQEKLGDSKLTLNAFIVSATQFASLLNVSCKQTDLEERNVLFMPEGGPVYLKKMFERVRRPLPEVRMAGEPVWLNQNQMSDLFQTTKRTSANISAIFLSKFWHKCSNKEEKLYE
jgi:hypothetical protein